MDVTNKKINGRPTNNQSGPPKKKRRNNSWMAPKPGLAKYARTEGEIQVEDEEVAFLTKAYWGVIKTQKRRYATRTLYNYRTSSITPQTISNK